MAERLILDDAQYGLLRSLLACSPRGRRVPKRDLLQHAKEANGLSPERAMKALGELHDLEIIRLDVSQRVFLASGVTLHPASSSPVPASFRADNGEAHLVVPEA